MSEMLNIGEAARLMGVCENTLRDWDESGKFKPSRTIGGHRRYSLSQIRERLRDQAPQEEEQASPQTAKQKQDTLIQKWEELGYLDDVANDETRAIAFLLENTEDNCESIKRACQNEAPLTTEQQLWLTKHAWLKLKLKKMIAIQPLTQPCGLAFYMKQRRNTMRIDSIPVAAQCQSYGFSFFKDVDFELMKEAYASAMARELDHIIFKLLTKRFPLNTDDLDSELKRIIKLYANSGIDCIVADKQTLDKIRNEFELPGIEMVEHGLVLHPKTYAPLAAAFVKPTSCMQTPIFMPYLILSSFCPATVATETIAKGLYRYGWTK